MCGGGGFLNGLSMRNGVVRMAKLKCDLHGAPVYTYYFTWQSRCSTASPAPGTPPTSPFCFDNTLRCEQGTGNTPEAQALAKKMATAWANFARTGNPSQPGLPWQPLTPSPTKPWSGITPPAWSTTPTALSKDPSLTTNEPTQWPMPTISENLINPEGCPRSLGLGTGDFSPVARPLRHAENVAGSTAASPFAKKLNRVVGRGFIPGVKTNPTTGLQALRYAFRPFRRNTPT